MEDFLVEGEIMASHTPRKLEKLSLELLVSKIIQSCFPIAYGGDPLSVFLQQILDPAGHRYVITPDRPPRLLDRILMSSEKRQSDLLPDRIKLIERLVEVRKWYYEWLGTQNSEIRLQVRRAVSEKLDRIDPCMEIPLYRFLLELLFGSKAGGHSDSFVFPSLPRVQCELWKKDCPYYADILRFFAPFDIEEFSTNHMTFGDPLPLLVVIENSPSLKKVFFRTNICGELLMCLRNNCPLLTTFSMKENMGAVMVPIDCLYKTFFRGKDFDSVMALANSVPTLDRANLVSFPNLRTIDVGDKNDLHKKNKDESLCLFLNLLLYFYSHSIHFSSYKMTPFSPPLPEELPECLRDITYRIGNVSLNALHKLGENCKSKSDVKLPLEKVLQLTLSHEPNDGSEVEKLIVFSKIWIPKLACKSLCFRCILPETFNAIDISVYRSLFSQVGHTLVALDFDVVGDVDIVALCDLISLCSNLEVLKIKLGKVHASSEDKRMSMRSLWNVQDSFDVRLNIGKLWKLSSLTVKSTERHAPLVHKLIEEFIEASPNLHILSLVLRDRPCHWLMSMASSKKLNSIDVLRINFHFFISLQYNDFDMRDLEDESSTRTSFYVFLIELLPNLKVLQLGLGKDTDCIFSELSQIYGKSNLHLSIWYQRPDGHDWWV